MRESLSLPMALPDGRMAVTRDISATGMYFVVPAGPPLGHWIMVEYERQAMRLKFVARGEVLRIEPGPYYTGIALRLHDARLVPLP